MWRYCTGMRNARGTGSSGYRYCVRSREDGGQRKTQYIQTYEINPPSYPELLVACAIAPSVNRSPVPQFFSSPKQTQDTSHASCISPNPQILRTPPICPIRMRVVPSKPRHAGSQFFSEFPFRAKVIRCTAVHVHKRTLHDSQETAWIQISRDRDEEGDKGMETAHCAIGANQQKCGVQCHTIRLNSVLVL
jgi:hypothetical protein